MSYTQMTDFKGKIHCSGVDLKVLWKHAPVGDGSVRGFHWSLNDQQNYLHILQNKRIPREGGEAVHQPTKWTHEKPQQREQGMIHTELEEVESNIK